MELKIQKAVHWRDDIGGVWGCGGCGGGLGGGGGGMGGAGAGAGVSNVSSWLIDWMKNLISLLKLKIFKKIQLMGQCKPNISSQNQVLNSLFDVSWLYSTPNTINE